MTPGSGVGRSTGLRETARNLLGRGNRANQTSGTAPEANRPENRGRITRTAELGSGRRRPELPGVPVMAPVEMGEGSTPRQAANRPPSVNSDDEGTVREGPRAEMPGLPMPARGTGQGRVQPWLDGVIGGVEAGPGSPPPGYASQAGSVRSVETSTTQRSDRSQLRGQRAQQEVADLQRTSHGSRFSASSIC
jgi:hypothetical protein